MAIPIDLRRDAAHSLQEQIYTQIRGLILNGRLATCARLPSSREMARDLGVSRNTVLHAYDRLKNEGYLDSQDNAGIFVSNAIPDQCLDYVADRRALRSFDREPPRRPDLRLEVTAPANVHLDRARARIDFWYGRFDRRNFPLNTWRRLINENLSRAGSNLSEYGAPAGCHELRKAVSSHLGTTRGMNAPADRIIITAGAQDGLNLVCRLLVQQGQKVAVENPCYGSAALLLKSYGAELCPVPVDHLGLRVENLAATHASLVYVTPSHQFPTGVTMPLERRHRLLDWAEKANSFVIEDDYDSDFRYDSPPLTALAGIDQYDRVIYVGSFSKSIGPGVRVGYLVLPEVLVQPALALKSLSSYGQPWLDQIVIADFIESGGYRNHLRKLRHRYHESRDALVAGLRKFFGPDADFSGDGCGMHILWRLPNGIKAADLVVAASKVDVGLYSFESVGAYEVGDSNLRKNSLVLGYSTLSPVEVTEGIGRVAAAVKSLAA
ncbi:MocR-like pyridoxine biosynthesis transcription factor PdxR [Bradyrhizobium cenepequi]